MLDNESQFFSASKHQSLETSALDDERHHNTPNGREHYNTVRSTSVNPVTGDDIANYQSKIDGKDTEEAQAFERKSFCALSSSQTQLPLSPDKSENDFQTQGIEKKRKRDVEALQTDLETDPAMRSLSTKLQKQSQVGFNSNRDAPSPALRQTGSPWAHKAEAAGNPLQPIERPLRLSTLASVTGVNRSRNKVVDVLALVNSVDESTVKPTHLPLKRDIRITDSSTETKVIVSIFVDPIDCIPTVGDVVLFRNLVTHDWKQGALNAYPKYCDGKDWYIPDPERVEGRGLQLKDRKARILATEEERRRLINRRDKAVGADHPEQGQKP